GNGLGGVEISGDGNVVAGNFIGTEVTGSAALGNDGPGVAIEDAASNNTVGGSATGARNVISGNTGHGIQFNPPRAGNVVQGNFVGTDVGGTPDRGNTLDGVNVINTSQVTIGGTAAGADNLIRGNDQHGVEITGTSAAVTVQANTIDSNGLDGVLLSAIATAVA